jgi:hypothetical protein
MLSMADALRIFFVLLRVSIHRRVDHSVNKSSIHLVISVSCHRIVR